MSSRMLEKAESKWRNEDYLGAIRDYEKIVEEFPETPVVSEAQYWEGVIRFLYLDDPENAIRAFKEVIGAKLSMVQERSQEARQYLADIYEKKLARPRDAISIYEEIIEKSADLEEILEKRYKIGALYYEMGDLTQARVEWDLLISRAPKSPLVPEALYRKGGTYFVVGNCREALKIYKEIYTNYAHDKMSEFAKFRAANCLEMEHHPKEALALYQELIGIYPDQDVIIEKVKSLESISINE
ncbi:MAG: tol-pal system YbgF family protein [Nitrospiria bacterium]